MNLATNLTHVETDQDLADVIASNEKVMIACGRMGPMCIPVYDVMEKIQDDYANVTFRDLAFDTGTANMIRSLPQTRNFRSLPFVIYYKDGEVVHATGGIQTKKQIKDALDDAFA